MDAQAFYRRFDALLEARDFAAAHALVGVASQIDAIAVIARYARGVLAMFERDFALADKEMQAVLSVDPNYAPAHHNRGAIAQWQQDARLDEIDQGFFRYCRLHQQSRSGHYSRHVGRACRGGNRCAGVAAQPLRHLLALGWKRKWQQDAVVSKHAHLPATGVR